MKNHFVGSTSSDHSSVVVWPARSLAILLKAAIWATTTTTGDAFSVHDTISGLNHFSNFIINDIIKKWQFHKKMHYKKRLGAISWHYQNNPHPSCCWLFDSAVCSNLVSIAAATFSAFKLALTVMDCNFLGMDQLSPWIVMNGGHCELVLIILNPLKNWSLVGRVNRP